ncbi:MULTISPECIES: ElyC/SanA/YdcF family protein [unclassified Lentimicrobium]|uniref:ElyC/SanA/YdcF family protein n=1 Tax=unclassified Lentimicrobium TaxID=2677434 RepID=UPI0015530CBF|nr:MULTISPECIES: ElyC/SanA/YdcF family protein [unclassified Lentimicrobium]NPD46354.1 DUF218 domain-containing protein [Lentimicrobium sp. S6]NPD85007.1 DUF218 domain-containing protein [Lentimicrobium sp. L6]
MSWRVKKEKYVLRVWVKLLILGSFLGLMYFVIYYAYSFLSPNQKVEAKILVVEGWLNDYALEESLEIFREGNYEHLMITGGPLNTGYVIMNYRSTADVSFQTLLEYGASPDSMTAVNRELVWRDRTYHSALELKKFLSKNYPGTYAFNLVSLGAHSRRSWLLFQKALPEHHIGIISINDRLYDHHQWWKNSKGFRSVLTEGIGYFYVLFFFSAYSL